MYRAGKVGPVSPLPTPDVIRETLLGRVIPDADTYWQAFIGPDKVALILMKGSSVVASAIRKIDLDPDNHDRRREQIITWLRQMAGEIIEWVQLGGEIFDATGIEVRLDQIVAQDQQ